MRRAAVAVAVLLASAAPAAAQAPSGFCLGEVDAGAVEQKPAGAPLRFGITPGVQTGQLLLGAQPPRTPESPRRHLRALNRLRLPDRPFVLRLHRFFWSDGEAGVRRFLALKDRYTSRGYEVELQLRYHPSAAQEGDIAAWTAHVRDVVRRFGADPRVIAIQVTNEVNLTFSPDSSDGSYDRARDALIHGVIAAKDEAIAHGYTQLEIGFNWAYRAPPQDDQAFWDAIRAAPPAFDAALDWVGLDVYPGTFLPPTLTPGGERDGIVNALSALRCYAGGAGVPATVPIHLEENGWPTNQLRSEARQAEALETMIRATHDFRGTYNVSDYRWFNLRDGDSTSPNFQVRYGLLRDDYTRKPAFGRYRRLLRQLA